MTVTTPPDLKEELDRLNKKLDLVIESLSVQKQIQIQKQMKFDIHPDSGQMITD